MEATPVPITAWSVTRFNRNQRDTGLAVARFLSANNWDTRPVITWAPVTKPVIWLVSLERSKRKNSMAGARELRRTGTVALPFASKRARKGYPFRFVINLPVKIPLGANCNLNEPELSGSGEFVL